MVYFRNSVHLLDTLGFVCFLTFARDDDIVVLLIVFSDLTVAGLGDVPFSLLSKFLFLPRLLGVFDFARNIFSVEATDFLYTGYD